LLFRKAENKIGMDASLNITISQVGVRQLLCGSRRQLWIRIGASIQDIRGKSSDAILLGFAWGYLGALSTAGPLFDFSAAYDIRSGKQFATRRNEVWSAGYPLS